MKNKFFILHLLFAISLFFIMSCSLSAQISKKTTAAFLADTAIAAAHMGISLYEPATNKYLFEHNANKYFTPASNVKLFSMYAGLTYLGKHLKGLYYHQTDTALFIYPTADPSFLWPEFAQQPVYDFLKNKNNIILVSPQFAQPLAYGWSWEDYKDYFMAQRSEFPIYGNLVTVTKQKYSLSINPPTYPYLITPLLHQSPTKNFTLNRSWGYDSVKINFTNGAGNAQQQEVITFEASTQNLIKFLSDTLHQQVSLTVSEANKPMRYNKNRLAVVYSQPTDSILKPMMHRSDNFFAEQILLMVSNEVLGYMNYDSIINYLLQNNLKDLPQKPQWVDGSGLSRYDLFSPNDFIFLLQKLKNEIGLERIKNLLPTGGEGTLKYYYKKNAGNIFAKTGTLNNNGALSGYLITKKNKLYLFSIMANNYTGGATAIRKAIEKFLTEVIEKN